MLKQFYKNYIIVLKKYYFIIKKTITYLDFGHATFIWGKDSSYLDKVVQII